MKQESIIIGILVAIFLLFIPTIYHAIELRVKYQGSKYLRDKDKLDNYNFEKNIRFEYTSIKDATINDHYKNFPFTIGDPRITDRLDLVLDESLGVIQPDSLEPMIFRDKNIFFIQTSLGYAGQIRWYGPFKLR